MAERIIPSGNTLVKYDNPVLVTKHDEKFTAQVTNILICVSNKWSDIICATG